MAYSIITVDFEDTNVSGANDNDSYKIYRGVNQDPYDTSTSSWRSNTLLKTVTSTDPEFFSGTGAITYIDDSADLGNAYYYRIEFLRSSDSASHISDVYGPLIPAAPYDLGYPNNIPSNDGSVPNFIDTEPLFHFSADYDANIGNLLGSVAQNQASTYSDYTMSHSHNNYGFTIRPWSLDNSVYIYAPHSSGSYWASRTEVVMPNDPITTSTQNQSIKYVLDEGYVLFAVFPGNYDYGATESGGVWSGGSTTTNGAIQFNQCLYYNELLQNCKLYKFSDKSEWVEPEPPLGLDGNPIVIPHGGRFSHQYVDPLYSGGAVSHYRGNFSTHSCMISSTNMGTNTNYHAPTSTARNLSLGAGINYTWTTTNHSGLYDSTKLNTVMVTSDGFGRAKGFLNGKMLFNNRDPYAISHVQPKYTSAAQKANGYNSSVPDSAYIYQSQTPGNFIGSWGAVPYDADGTNTHAESDPYRSAGLKTVKRRVHPILGNPTLSNNPFCEYILVPKQLELQSTIRIIKYINEKYEGKTATQFSYFGL